MHLNSLLEVYILVGQSHVFDPLLSVVFSQTNVETEGQESPAGAQSVTKRCVRKNCSDDMVSALDGSESKMIKVEEMLVRCIMRIVELT